MADQGLVEHIDPTDLPFLPPPDRIIDLHLPRPPSTNRIWRAHKAGKSAVSLSPQYVAWKRQADMAVMVTGALRGVRRINGKFEVRIILQRCAGDLDNRIKGLLDWAQSRELIAEDKHCERIIAEWGDAPRGCRLILREISVPHETPEAA